MHNGSMPPIGTRANGHAADVGSMLRSAPHNVDAEAALLGAILLNNASFDQVAGLISAGAFFNPLHARIYDCAATHIREGRRADPITLRATFEHDPPIRSDRGPGLSVPAYLGRLVTAACTETSVADYARLLADLERRRDIIHVCEATAAEAYDAPIETATDAIATAGARALGLLGVGSADHCAVLSRCLADVEPVEIDWLWPERLALGKLSLIAGVPGLGKSQLTCGLTARVTAGGRWPDGTPAPLGSVVFITCEDDAADTIRPRLDAAGADVNRVHLLDWALGEAREREHFDVRRHMPALAGLVRRIGDVRLIIIDPITAYLGRTDSHVTAEVRGALNPLQTLAAETGSAIVLVSHLNKSGTDRSAMNRVTGSGAFVAVCRSAWLVGLDPQDSSRRRRVFTPLKNNIGDDRTGFAYTIEGASVGHIKSSRVVFDPTPIQVAADDLLQPAAPASHDERSALDEAIAFLREELADGPKPSRWVEKAARDAGISPRTLDTARGKLGVRAKRQRDGWRIRLPDPPA